ncbi:hypothetical protein IQ233_04905 [Nodularia sp. LEGE 06071]|nr:hypothetical protein [Nodularia sp. LEGE 06071]MCC2691083.1 hypothetical protein [Nodularia sp. LEGE 04288]
MPQPELLNEFLSLPAEAQRQVIEFIAFLRQRYVVVEPASQSSEDNFINYSFIGMWSDRQNLTDSTAWVRNIREHECSNSHD